MKAPTKVHALDVELSDETFMSLALMAHEQGITLNQLAQQVLKDKLHEEEVAELKAEIKMLQLADHLRKNTEPAKKTVEELKALKVGDVVEIVQGGAGVPPNIGFKGPILAIDRYKYEYNYKVGSIYYRLDELKLAVKDSE